MINLLIDLGVHNLKPITLHCDNVSAMHIAHNPVLHERKKNISIDCHFTRENILEGLLQLQYLPTSQWLADILTKIYLLLSYIHYCPSLVCTFLAQACGGMIIYYIYNLSTPRIQPINLHASRRKFVIHFTLVCYTFCFHLFTFLYSLL